MKKYLGRSPGYLFGLLFITLILSIGLWISCGQDYTPSGPEESQTIILSASDPQVKAVMDLQDKYTPTLMAKPGVIGTATGLVEDGTPAIIVLAQSEALMKGADVPSIIENIPVRIEVIGEVKALKGPPGGGGGVDPTARFPRPVPIGVSTGHPAITAGTIGCRVTKGGNVYALSNNHVYADENQASIGDDVIQPGTFDGGSLPDDFIGDLADFETIVFSTSANNVVDAAIASTTTSLVSNSTPSDGYGTPKSTTVSASPGMRVMKYGRTTGQTKGRVDAINATVNVGYSSGVARFVDQIIIRPGGFSSGGDSGSLIVVEKGQDARKPVGLLFAGSSTVTIANPINEVLNAFGVTVDGE